MLTDKDWQAAEKRGREWMESNPHAVSAVYLPYLRRIMVTLNTGIEVAIDPSRLQTLQNAKTSMLREIEITPMGDALFFPKLDDGIYLPGILRGVYGTRRWMEDKIRSKRAASSPIKARRVAA
jgi:hypothetical protein